MRESDKVGLMVEITPDAADIRIEVATDGVHIGFFSDDGQSAVLNLDKLSAGGAIGSVSAAALAAWAADRRKQAKRLAG